MTLYIHRIVVTIVTPECSPDVYERQIDETIGARDNSVDARTDPQNRSLAPSVTIPDPPAWPTSGLKADEAAYFTAYDTWRDEFFPHAYDVAQAHDMVSAK